MEDGGLTRTAGHLPQPEQPQRVLAEAFAPISVQLRLSAVAALARSCRDIAARFRQELDRRDLLSKTLHLWGSGEHWSALFQNVPSVDWTRRSWVPLPPMTTGRTKAVCAMLDQGIYVVGGTRRGRPTNSADKFCLRSGAWESLPPLLGRRRVDTEAAAAAVVERKLYICGGISLHGPEASACVDRFDPEEYVWETMPPLPSPRCRAAAAVLGGVLYVCGGSERSDGSGMLSSVVRFEKDKLCWDSAPPMLQPRSGSLAVAANGSLYVGHGQRREQQEDLLPQSPMAITAGERFNVDSGRWSRVHPGMLSTPGAAAAAALSDWLFVCGGTAQGPRSDAPTSHVVGAEQSSNGGGAGVRVALSPWLSPTGALAIGSPVAATAPRTGVRVLRRNWTT